MIERYFTDEQIDEFLAAYLERYPDALDRIIHVMQNPFDDNDELIARTRKEMWVIVPTLDFYIEMKKDDEEKYFLIARELFRKISLTVK
ncbi:hypothetical protein [Agrobacterium pusense]|jgi:hypothetical protein|uniref:hypothetical protein n=1 Tax=Agrobacterium pusense TaxID=648995 RepID=UPI0037C0A0BA